MRRAVRPHTVTENRTSPPTLFILASAIGLSAFLWPLLVAVQRSGTGAAHVTDAPVVIALTLPLLVAAALSEARRGGDARQIALLGALVAVNAFLRIPKGPSGEGFIFILPILAGWAMGWRFGFLLGSLSLLASAVITAGVGPWLPFQMFGVGWVGAGAGGLRILFGSRGRVWVLGVWAAVSSLGYGVLMTLWFWPFVASGSQASYAPGLGLLATIGRFAQFYALTSMPWDVGRALLTNVPLVVLLARPVGAVLDRAHRRFTATVSSDLENEV